MGRRPNQVILEFFQRGPKLNDNSNRYPQTCKLCGEHFSKGRIDNLTSHLMKKCPMISEEQRIRACLALNGVTTPRGPRSLQSRQQQQVQQPQILPELNLSMLQSQQSWTPLETLAEVSRQINHLNEHGEDGGQSQHALSSAEPMSGVITSAVPNTSAGTDHFQMQEQFTLQSPQSSHKEQPQEKQAAMEHERRGSQEQAQGSQEATNNSADAPNMTVAAAAAATARLNSAAIMDAALFPSLGGNLGGNLGEELARAIGSVETGQQDGVAPIPATFAPTSEAGAPTAPARDHSPSRESQPPAQMTPSSSLIRIGAGEVSPLTPALDNRSPAPENHPPSSVATTPSRTTQLPWGEFTYMTNTATPPMPSSIKPMTGLPTKSVFRLEQNGNKSKHARARFEETRRKEVQQIRMIGACVRCRILRKTCSKGDPCDTCRKVLAPRLWRAGCIRIKFTDELDLYNAGVQIAHCQKMVNGYKATMNLNHTPVVLDATHSSSGVTIAVEALRGTKPNELIDPTVSEEYQTTVPQIIMIDDQEDLPEKMEAYVGAMLPEFIRKEEANFSRITLETALELHCRTDDEKAVLKMALELWGYVEVIERELKWDLSIRPSPIARVAAKSITRETDDDLYKTICLQLTAAAERRAMITSKELLKKMQQMLQHGRTAICHPMFFAILVLLITLEKSTWAFKSWEEVEALRECWPLENAPSYYTSQGFRMSEIFRMLLVIRKALPKIAVREGDGVLVLDDPDPIYGSYLERINLKASNVIKQMRDPAMDYASSRTLELHFCSHILLPDEELQTQGGVPSLAGTPNQSVPQPPASVPSSQVAPVSPAPTPAPSAYTT